MNRLSDIERLLSASLSREHFESHEMRDEYNFSWEELTTAVREGYLSRPERGFYRIENKLRVEFFLSVMLNKIYLRDYDGALDIIDKLLALQIGIKEDYNCYLFILDQIIVLDPKHKEYVDSLTIDDIRNPDRNKYYNIILSIFQTNLSAAKVGTVLGAANSDNPSLHDQIMISLLDAACKEQMRVLEGIMNLFLQGDFQAGRPILEERMRFHKLGLVENEILILMKVFEAIGRFRVSLCVEETKSKSFYDVLMSGDFKRLHSIMKSSTKANEYYRWYYFNHAVNNRIFKALTSRISQEVENLKKDAYKNGEIILQCPIELIVKFTDIIDAIMDGKFQDGLDILRCYLEDKDKGKYFDVIANLFKLSVREEDFTFYMPLKALAIVMSRNPSLRMLDKYLADRPDGNKSYAILPTREYRKKKSSSC